MHPRHVDLHRVGAVVLLRMLQEAPVASEIVNSGAWESRELWCEAEVLRIYRHVGRKIRTRWR